jgi:hypothetical protein
MLLALPLPLPLHLLLLLLNLVSTPFLTVSIPAFCSLTNLFHHSIYFIF